MPFAIDLITQGVSFADGKFQVPEDQQAILTPILRQEVDRRKAFIRDKAHHRTGCRHCGEPWPTEPACPLCRRAAVKVAEEDRAAWKMSAPSRPRPMARTAKPKAPTCVQGHPLDDGACAECAAVERCLAAVADLKSLYGGAVVGLARSCACGWSAWFAGHCASCGKPDPEHRVKAEVTRTVEIEHVSINTSAYFCKVCKELTLHRGPGLKLDCVKCGSKTWVCRHCGQRVDADPCVWCRDGNGGALLAL